MFSGGAVAAFQQSRRDEGFPFPGPSLAVVAWPPPEVASRAHSCSHTCCSGPLTAASPSLLVPVAHCCSERPNPPQWSVCNPPPPSSSWRRIFKCFSEFLTESLGPEPHCQGFLQAGHVECAGSVTKAHLCPGSQVQPGMPCASPGPCLGPWAVGHCPADRSSWPHLGLAAQG